MNTILKAASYFFHPLWMPFAGTLIYFLVTPRFFPESIIKAKLMAIAIMTMFIPIVFFFLLKTLGKVTNAFLKDVKERNWPLLFYAGLLLVALNFVIDPYDYPELYYYFIAILFSTVAALVLVWFNKRISLHMMGLGGLLVFITALSFHFNIDFVYTIGFLIAIIGLTASSRLHFNAHTSGELVIGLLTGIAPQLLVLGLWL